MAQCVQELEKKEDVTYVVDYITKTDIDIYVPTYTNTGTLLEYTFFCPTDAAVSRLLVPRAPDPFLLDEPFRRLVLLNHLVAGDLTEVDLQGEVQLQTLGNGMLVCRKHGGNLTVNDVIIHEAPLLVPGLGNIYFLDEMFFVTPQTIITVLEKHSALPTTTTTTTTTTTRPTTTRPPPPPTTAPPIGESKRLPFFLEMQEILSFHSNGEGIRFLEHLKEANISHLFNDFEYYTVLVPRDFHFKQYDRLAQGFSPFSVPEFNKQTILNHFIHGRLLLSSIRDGYTAQTLGGRTLRFQRDGATITVNGALIIPELSLSVPQGSILYVDDVLFVDPEVVSELQAKYGGKKVDYPTVPDWNTQNPSAPDWKTQNPSVPDWNTQNPSVPVWKTQNPSAPDLNPQSLGSAIGAQSLSPAVSDTDSQPQKQPFFSEIQSVLGFSEHGGPGSQFLKYLRSSNIADMFGNEWSYTVLVPINQGFQKFYISNDVNLFDMADFRQETIINHFLGGARRMEDITDKYRTRTLGGRNIVFRKLGGHLTVNGVEVISEHPLYKGTIFYIQDVLFVEPALVEELRTRFP